MLKKLITDYLLLTIEHRKAIARRMTLVAQEKSQDILESAWNREKDISKTLVNLRNRIKIENQKLREKFNSNIAKLLSSIIIEIYFDPNNYIDNLKNTSLEELWAMIKTIDDTLSDKETNEVLSNLTEIRG